MPITKKLVKMGNSLGVIIDSALLKAFNWDLSTLLEITVDTGLRSLTISEYVSDPRVKLVDVAVSGALGELGVVPASSGHTWELNPMRGVDTCSVCGCLREREHMTCTEIIDELHESIRRQFCETEARTAPFGTLVSESSKLDMDQSGYKEHRWSWIPGPPRYKGCLDCLTRKNQSSERLPCDPALSNKREGAK